MTPYRSSFTQSFSDCICTFCVIGLERAEGYPYVLGFVKIVRGWICCKCKESRPIALQFCNCGHARNLKSGEKDECLLALKRKIK